MDGFVLLSLLIILYVLGMPIVFIINSNRNTKKLLFELKMMKLQMDSIQKKKQESFESETVTEEEFQPEYENEDVVVVNEPYEPQLEYAYERVQTENEKPKVAQIKKSGTNYEKFIGENLFGKIGILVFVLGMGLFVKYAIDQDWINETFRTILGFVVGFGLLVTAERLQKKYRTFSSLLAGGAFAIFYLTIAIAYHYYGLFSSTVTFIMLVALTILMPALAVLYDRRELAIISLIGSFLAPFIVSSSDGNYLALFTYISLVNIGMFILSIRKKWGELPVLSFVFTYLIMYIYIITLTGFEYNTTGKVVNLLLFCTLFYFIFLFPFVSVIRSAAQRMQTILLSVIILNNFIYLGLGYLLFQILATTVGLCGLLCLFIAMVNMILLFWLKKKEKTFSLFSYALLGVVLTFVTITIPIQLEGKYITLFWASEVVLLLWLYIKSHIKIYEMSLIAMVPLTIISYIMDLSTLIKNIYSIEHDMFINPMFFTSLYLVACISVYLLLMGKYRKSLQASKTLNYEVFYTPVQVVLAAFIYFILMREFFVFFNTERCIEAMTLFTSGFIMVVSYISRNKFPMAKYYNYYNVAISVNLLLFVLTLENHYIHSVNQPMLLFAWINVLFVAINIFDVAKRYFKDCNARYRYMVFVNILGIVLWLSIVRLFLETMDLGNFPTAFSLALSIAGFVQMGLGMRFHLKSLRIISLFTLGIVLAKLFFIDLWAMPSLGKIVVFVCLGLILLILSFLYQKLRNVLFKDDENIED